VVAHPRAPARPHRLRPLREPRPVAVEADGEGRPVAVTLSGRRMAVLQVQDTWRIDDEWWRERPVSRLYWRVSLEDGRVVTVYADLVRGGWYEQRYGRVE
jgi:protein ImuB